MTRTREGQAASKAVRWWARGLRASGPRHHQIDGEFLKPDTPSNGRKAPRCGRGNDLGYGKRDQDVTMDDPQPSPTAEDHLRYGCSSTTKCWWVSVSTRPAHLTRA